MECCSVIITDVTPINPRSRWYVGVDLGQSFDPTAVAIVEAQTRAYAQDFWYSMPEEQLPPDAVRPENHWFGESGRQHSPNRIVRLDVRHLERLPLHMSYVDQVAKVKSLVTRPPLDKFRPTLVVDQTGVGRPVVDMFRRAPYYLRPDAVTITAGNTESFDQDRDYRVSKIRLVSRLQAALHSGELRIAKELPEAKTLVSELQDFRGIFTESGNARFGAREGAHDDLVLAVAICAWKAHQYENNEVRLSEVLI